eukprot:m.126874 g.126874  ORF g.126874 m.126874 type:complete len:61 (-) comp15645_c1_seq3:1594-1776(-)
MISSCCVVFSIHETVDVDVDFFFLFYNQCQCLYSEGDAVCCLCLIRLDGLLACLSTNGIV